MSNDKIFQETPEGGRMIPYEDYYHMGPPKFKDGDVLYGKVILVLGWGNDYAVYIGPTSWPWERIASNGDKLHPERGRAVANGLWPLAIRDREYRP